MGFVRRHPFVAALLFLFAAGASVLVITFVAVWRAAHTDDASRIDHTDVIIVLGAAQYNGTPSPVFAGRLEQAENLFHQGRAPRVLVVGSKEPGDIDTEAAAGRSWLIAHGLPAGSVFADPQGNSTLTSLEGAAAFMKARGLSSAFLVSDPWHNLRIKRMASDLGIQGYASATWHSAAESEGPRLDGYIRETFAYLYYRVFGR